jgi:colicin import membrane protein
MASRRTDQHLAFALSIFGHAAIVAALTFSIPLGRTRPSAGEIVVPIETVMINEAAIEAEIARMEAAEEAERIRQAEEAERVRQQQEAEQRELERIRLEREAAEQAAELERQRVEVEAAAERERLLILEREREEAERLAEQERLERERLEAERIAAEQAAEEERRRQEEERRRQEEERLAAERWARAISDRVALYWIRPPNVSSELECVLIVTQLPNGDVVNVTVDQCNTNDGNIIRSIENAVLNASPLPQPPRGVAFERVVRITFRPDD